MVSVFVGNEPYVRDHCLKALLKSYPQEAVSEITSFTEAEARDLETINLFSMQKAIVVYRVDSLKIEGALKKYLQKPGDNKDLAIVANSTAVKKFPETVKVTKCDKLSESELRKFILKGVSSLGMRVTENACQQLIEGSGYLTDNDVNLYRISMLLKQLKLKGDDVDAEKLSYFLADSGNNNSFLYIGWLLQGKAKDFLQAMHREAEEGTSSVIRVLGLLGSRLRIGFRLSSGLSAEDIGERYLGWYRTGFPASKYLEAMDLVQAATLSIKSGADCRFTTNKVASDLTQVFEKNTI